MQLDAGPGFTGHATDVATGLTYMQQRYMDQELGRFLTPDPQLPDANTGANINRYWYADNNPVKNVDPDGRSPIGTYYPGSSSFPNGSTESLTSSKQKSNQDNPKLEANVKSKQAYSQVGQVGQVDSNINENKNTFVLRVGKELQNLKQSTGFEFCGQICPTETGLQVKIFTVASHVTCSNPIACANGLNIHNHGVDRFRVNKLDYEYIKSEFPRVKIGQIWPGQTQDQFSPEDYKHKEGYLSGEKGVYYQHGKGTTEYIGDYGD